jgi:hypothetical protein
LVDVPAAQTADATYRSVTRRIVDLATAAASGTEPVVGLTLSARREGVDHTGDLATRLELGGHLVLRLDPGKPSSDKAIAFVAMPYGKRGPRRDYDADATYKRILLPAIVGAGLRPVRADSEALLEVIDITMLRTIGSASIVIADLATLNPNVMWEVGVRHAWRRSGTILLRPQGTLPPFDVSHARVHEYGRSPAGVDDRQAIDGIRRVATLLEAVQEDKVDSPVFATLGTDVQETHLRTAAPDDASGAASQRLAAVSLAADLGDADALRQLAQDIGADAALEDRTRRPLLEHVGFGLIDIGRHGDAAAVLAPIAEADVGMDLVRLQQQYAHALIRDDNPDGRGERLIIAERRLQSLRSRHAASGETMGLLASAAKTRVEVALSNGELLRDQLDLAIDLYLDGFRNDPGDYYPGIVAVALLRLRGQRLVKDAVDVDRAAELLPIVRFALTRLGGPEANDAWGIATLAEIDLHHHFLHDDAAALERAGREYGRVGAIGNPNQRASAARQLRLMRDAGDPDRVIAPLRQRLLAGPPS